MAKIILCNQICPCAKVFFSSSTNMFEDAKSLELSKLKSVTADYGTLTTKISFNGGSYNLELNVPDKKGIRILVHMLQELCGFRSAEPKIMAAEEPPALSPRRCRSCGATNPPQLGACEYCETLL